MSKISVSEIIVNNKYLRVNSNVDELVKSIEKIGLINPLIVNKKNELLAGGRRYAAIKQLGWDKVLVSVVSKNNLEEELISIDENLMRAPLDDVEFDDCLRRAKEIYEALNPDAISMEEEDSEEPIDIDSSDPAFCDYLSKRTNLSPGIIKKAIERDEKNSSRVKKLRSQGEINTTQANHLVKLSKKDQDEILPYVLEAPKPKIKDIVKDIIDVGMNQAVSNYANAPLVPREYTALANYCKKIKKVGSRILAEQLDVEGPEVDEALKQIKEAKKIMNEILNSF